MLARLVCAFTSALSMALFLPACGSDGGGGNADGAGGAGAGGSAGTAGTGNGSASDPVLPAAAAVCPEFHAGMTTINSSGVDRQFQIYIDDAAAAAKDGPIVFYFYGTLGTPAEAQTALTADGVKHVTDAGGMVIAPVHDNMGVFPWIQDTDINTDYQLMDDIIGCAKSKVGIDAKHIHVVGFSAGGLFAADASYTRSTYLASVATFSGGGTGMFANPSNLFPAMILFGGANDMLVLNFQDSSKMYYQALTAAGHFAFECNHGGGHSLPPAAGASVVQFFFDHPWGTNPSPYKNALPAGFPSYCTLTPPM
ncbi:MAG TPA: hypothetical protein VH062_12100 [Polyangiaceae bacterium]|jgi:poly(3-hydroxybutyrate) depolymerase|nr:hypothetical protein [Polyangiaceae bacterium]